TLGSGATSGKLVIGSTGAITQTVSGLATSGSGTDNRVVGGATGISTLAVNVAAGVDTYNGFIGGAGTNENNLALTKSGVGTLILTNTPTYSGTTTINSGVLQTNSTADLTGFVTFGATTVPTRGVWQTNGTLTRTLSTTANATNLNWVSFNGFAAKGGSLALNLNGGAALTWNSNGFMGAGGATIVFGSATADSQVLLPNDINLATADNFQRPIYVDQGTGGDSAKLSGVLSPGAGATGITKQGTGILILSGNNTYTGQTNITAGTVKIENANSLGYQTNVAVANTSAGANATTVSTGATLDLNGQSGILEAINLNGTGVGGNGALINSNTGAAASINIGLTSLGLGAIGAGYTAPTVDITGVGGTGATGTVVLGATAGASSITLTNVGSGYTTAPTVTITDLTGVGATATATVSGVNLATTSSVGGAGDLVINASVRGVGGLTKIGNGKLTLTGSNPYTGGTTLNSGFLIVENVNALGAGTGALTVNNGTFILGQNQTLAMNGSNLTWTGGNLNFNLNADGTSDQINLFGLFSKGAGSATLNFDFGATGVLGQVYTLINFTSTDFVDVSQFTYSYLGDGTITGEFAIDGTHLTFTPIPEPGVVVLLIVGLGLVVFRQRKRVGATRE
ncbi:MAG: beta strand repeat-containing protein, partial [Bradyrhizobium sp.]